MTDEDELSAIADPGEIGRAEHTAGDRSVIAVGNLVAWLFPLLVIAICMQVVLRFLGHNQAWLDDLQWWFYGVAVLTGVAYAVTTGSHVRVDIFFDRFPERRKARIDIFGLVWLFLPFVMMAWDVTLHYAISSVTAWERSDSPNGLHNLWILKILVNLCFLLMGVAAWSAYVRRLRSLTEPLLWKQLLFAFPSTVYAMNLAVYYAVWWVFRLRAEPGTSHREILRLPYFDDLNIGPFESTYSVVLGFVLACLAIGLAWALHRRRGAL